VNINNDNNVGNIPNCLDGNEIVCHLPGLKPELIFIRKFPKFFVDL